MWKSLPIAQLQLWVVIIAWLLNDLSYKIWFMYVDTRQTSYPCIQVWFGLWVVFWSIASMPHNQKIRFLGTFPIFVWGPLNGRNPIFSNFFRAYPPLFWLETALEDKTSIQGYWNQCLYRLVTHIQPCTQCNVHCRWVSSKDIPEWQICDIHHTPQQTDYQWAARSSQREYCYYHTSCEQTLQKQF